MKENGKRGLLPGLILLAAFAVWTLMVRTVDVQNIGPERSEVGFATVNKWFHDLTGVHMPVYTVTDRLGLVPIFVCICFGIMGLVQLIRRRSLLKVDTDILLLGVYYVMVILAYLLFEMIPVNHRPVIIDGRLEASYPSSTTLLVLSVMPTLNFQADRRITGSRSKKIIIWSATGFSVLMTFGRLISGVHWLTDIAGSVLLSLGLYMVYRYMACHV